jgi:predicted PurR-regulated permease PerM
MSDDLKDILSNSNKDIDNQQLMDYLANQLSKAQTHEVEANMAEDPFLNDAVEGLQNIEPTEKINNYTIQLNQELQKVIAKNKKAREKRRWKDSPTIYLVIISILLLVVLCFFLLKKRFFDEKKDKAVAAQEQVMSTPISQQQVNI